MAPAWLALLAVMASVALQVQAKTEAPVAKRISLSGVQLAIIKSDGSTVKHSSAGPPSKLIPSSVEVTPAATLELTFSIADSVKPQQVFLVLSHTATGTAAYAVAKSKKDGAYTVTAPLTTLQKQIGNQAGQYAVSLLVGDQAVVEGVNWELGSLTLLLPGVASSPPPLRTALQQPLSNQLPIIRHIFRSAEKRPPALVSLVFTGLSLAPLALVVLYVSTALGVNFKAWPRETLASAACLAFHGLLAAMVGLYLLFWTRLNLAQTLPLVGVLAVPLALSGHRALAGLADIRLAASKKD